MIRYKVTFYGTARIERIRIDRETGCFVFSGRNREAKSSEHSSIFETFDEAKALAVRKALGRVDSTKATLKRAESELTRVLALQPNPEL